MAKVKLKSKETEYLFDIQTIVSDLPEIGGLYVVLKQTEPKKYTVLYIGRTNNFKTRHSDHHKADCFSENGATHIGIHKLESDIQRIIVEFALQQNYELVCEG